MGYSLSKGRTVVEIAILINNFLFGITTVQAALYFAWYPDDRPFLKFLAAFLWVLEFVHTVLISHLAVGATVNLELTYEDAFDRVPADISAITLLATLIACLVQAYLIDRVRRFRGSIYSALLVWSIIVLSFTGGVVLTVLSFTLTLDVLTYRWGWLTTTCWILMTLTDSLIALFLTYDLLRHRRSTFTRTTRLLDRILAININSGLLSSLISIVLVISFLLDATSLVYLGIFICASRVHSNTLFATLNVRRNLQDLYNTSSTLRFAEENVPASVSVNHSPSV